MRFSSGLGIGGIGGARELEQVDPYLAARISNLANWINATVRSS